MCLYSGRMNIQVAVLCDAATDDNGKLNLLGAFDTIYTQQLPAIHPQCSIALRVTFSSGDEGKHNLQLNFVDADGRSIAKFPDRKSTRLNSSHRCISYAVFC